MIIKMRLQKFVLFSIFIIYFISPNLLCEDIDYRGLSIIVNENHYAKLLEMYNERKSLYKLTKINALKKKNIIDSLKENFKSMVDKLKTNFGDMPDCVQDALKNTASAAGSPGNYKIQITYSELGIFHTIYQLLDAEGQTVQWDSEKSTAQKMSEIAFYFLREIC